MKEATAVKLTRDEILLINAVMRMVNLQEAAARAGTGTRDTFIFSKMDKALEDLGE
jgi:hypothetical protein